MTLKKIVIVLISVMVVSSVAFAQGRGQGRGQGAQGFCLSSQDAVVVEGKIVKIETVENTKGRFDNGLHLVVKTKKGNQTIHMGPKAWLVEKGLTFKKGAVVKMKTVKGTINNAPVVVASEVTQSGVVVTVRDKSGRPMWRRSLDPDQRKFKNRRGRRGRGWGKGRGQGRG